MENLRICLNIFHFPLNLLSRRNARAADVSVDIEDAQRDCVFARSFERNFNRVAFGAAVGDAVVGENFAPIVAVDAVFGARDKARRVRCVERNARSVAGYLRRARCGNRRRRVVDVNRFAQSFAGERERVRV